MSRIPQRWRTQRNAIRNANCRTSWIIKILNAYCASGLFPGAYLSECPETPLSRCCTYQCEGELDFDSVLNGTLFEFICLVAGILSALWLDRSHLATDLVDTLVCVFSSLCCVERISWTTVHACGWYESREACFFILALNLFSMDLRLSKTTRWI